MLHSIQKVNYGSKSIEYRLCFVDRKSLGIKVLPTGDVNVIAPLDASLIDINKKVKSKASWILKQQDFFNSYKPNTPERKFINDNDTVIMKGFCKNNEIRIGFGEVTSKLLPPFTRK